MVKLGFIGFGEAAFNIAKGLKQEGLDGIIAYDKFWNVAPQSELIAKRAAEASVMLVPSMQQLVESSGTVMSAVSANMSVPLAQAAKPFLKQSQLYVDLNATSPMTKEEADAIISPVALFVDCAVMGPVPNYKHKVPVSVSGKGAKRFHGRDDALRDEDHLHGCARWSRFGFQNVPQHLHERLCHSVAGDVGRRSQLRS